jgi:hypothetical protein
MKLKILIYLLKWNSSNALKDFGLDDKVLWNRFKQSLIK